MRWCRMSQGGVAASLVTDAHVSDEHLHLHLVTATVLNRNLPDLGCNNLLKIARMAQGKIEMPYLDAQDEL